MKTTYTTFSLSNFQRYFRKMPHFSLLSPQREVYVLLYFQISHCIIAMYKGSIWSSVHVLHIPVLPFSPLS